MRPSPFPPHGHRPDDGWTLGRVAIVGTLAIGAAIAFVTHPPTDLLALSDVRGAAGSRPSIAPLASAFGESGEVRLQLRMPGELFDFPIAAGVGAEKAEYQWLKAEDSSAGVPPRGLNGTTVAAPVRPG